MTDRGHSGDGAGTAGPLSHIHDLGASASTAGSDGSMPSRLWCVILNWHDWESTEACVRSTRASRVVDGVVIVDNESDQPGDDGRGVRVERSSVAGVVCTIVSCPENRGFAGGVNLGIREALGAGADSILVLNNDLTLEPGAADEMHARLINDPSLGAVGARILLPRETGAGLERVQCLGGGYVRPFMGNVYQRRVPSQPLHYVSGACVLLSRRAAEACDGFDERYFMYWEDVALGLRLATMGFKLATCTSAVARHGASGSRARAGALLETYETWSALTFSTRAGGLLGVSIPVRQVGVALGRLLIGDAPTARAKLAGIRYWMRFRGRSPAYRALIGSVESHVN